MNKTEDKKKSPRNDSGGRHKSSTNERRLMLCKELDAEMKGGVGFTHSQLIKKIMEAEGLPEAKKASVEVYANRFLKRNVEDGTLVKHGQGGWGTFYTMGAPKPKPVVRFICHTCKKEFPEARRKTVVVRWRNREKEVAVCGESCGGRAKFLVE